ncbi:hypothetical protein DE146DRAFT_521552 [Phaeosphaeria sp. MPI-PUGE-AT-0046c]|nr:hypothetical protein DE146DRAFT_521552 [Phaeosphaeria sp. MPI-PUGE-AT-0046c]
MTSGPARRAVRAVARRGCPETESWVLVAVGVAGLRLCFVRLHCLCLLVATKQYVSLSRSLQACSVRGLSCRPFGGGGDYSTHGKRVRAKKCLLLLRGDKNQGRAAGVTRGNSAVWVRSGGHNRRWVASLRGGARGDEPEDKARYMQVDTSTSIHHRSPLIITTISPDAAARPSTAGRMTTAATSTTPSHRRRPPCASPMAGGVMSVWPGTSAHAMLPSAADEASFVDPFCVLLGCRVLVVLCSASRPCKVGENKDGHRLPSGSRSVRICCLSLFNLSMEG